MALARALADEAARMGSRIRLTAASDPARRIDVRGSQHLDVLLFEDYAGAAEELDRVLCAMPADSDGPRVLVMREATTDAQRLRLIQAGAFGCVRSGDPIAMVVKAILSVHAGVPWFPRVMMFEALHRAAHADVPADSGTLTRRESEVLALIGGGLTNKEIARRLGISDGTVKTHLHRIYVKLELSGRYKAFARKASA